MVKSKFYIVKNPHGEALDAICYRIYGGAKENWQALLRANPGISDLGDLVPKGKK